MLLGDDTATAPASDWLTTLANSAGSIVSSVEAAQTAKQVSDINAQRLAAGQPPLTQAEIQSLTTTAGVSVGLSPDTQNLLIWGALGIGALFMIWILTKNH
jgi:hypothetical protein